MTAAGQHTARASPAAPPTTDASAPGRSLACVLRFACCVEAPGGRGASVSREGVMKRFLIAAALLAAVAAPLAAQQDSTRAQEPTPVPASAPAAAPTSTEAPAATPTGPRVRAEFRPAEATIKENRASMYQSDTHTISVSTVVLVLLVVVLVLLVVR